MDDVTSPCIDAGDPSEGVGPETLPNGGRINIGVYGGTSEASRSPARWVVFAGAGNSESLSAWASLRWSARGTNWTPGETVRLDYSGDNGTNWTTISGAAGLAFTAGQFWWDTRTVPNGRYRFRVTANAAPMVVAVAERTYTVDNNLNSPVLSWTGDPGFETNGVEPDVGLDVTNFVFRATYVDADNQAPASGFPRLRVTKGGVEIDGSPFAMTGVSAAETNYAGGKRYKSAALTLAAGSAYIYVFEAQDIHAAPAVSADPVMARSGPVVIKTAKLRVASTYGGVTVPPGTNVCIAGTPMACGVTNSPVTMGLTQYVCVGWGGTGSVTNGAGTNAVFILDEDSSVTWQWRTNFWLAASNSGPGWVTATNGWLPCGFHTNVVAVPSSYYHFLLWTGTVNSASNPLPLTMDQAHVLVALFSENLATNDTPEWWLAGYGWTNAFNAAATNDSDRDGMLAWQEYGAGTDPTNPASYLGIVAISNAALSGLPGTLVRWQSVTGRFYRVGRETNLLTSPLFQFTVRSNVPATPPFNTVTDTNVTGKGTYFYRIGVE
jgi:hypothetical protein